MGSFRWRCRERTRAGRTQNRDHPSHLGARRSTVPGGCEQPANSRGNRSPVRRVLYVVSRRATASRRADAQPLSTRRWTGPLEADFALPTRSEPFSAPGWLYELKYDGFRLSAAKDGMDVTLQYRSGRNVTSMFPELAAAIAALPVQRALLDGELVAFGPDGRPDFEHLRQRALSRRGSATSTNIRACLFDVLALDHEDLRPLPLLNRKQALRELLSKAGHLLVYVEHVDERGEELLVGARELRLEGIVAKRADSPYPAGRTGSWRKIKVEETDDFIVVGIAAPSEGTFWRPSLIVAVNAGAELRYIGRVAVGQIELDALQTVIPKLQRPSSPCRGAGRAEVWFEPALVCEVRFLASSQRGLRHPVFVRFRPDKRREECCG